MVTFAELQTQARPMRWYIKLLSAVLALVFFAVLATLAIAGFLVYRIVKPQRTSTEPSAWREKPLSKLMSRS